MRKARKTLVGVAAILLLAAVAFAAPTAGAKTKPKPMEFLFQGGEAFGGPPVGMSMTGTDAKAPKRVGGFSITGLDLTCGTETRPSDRLETLPITTNAGVAVADPNTKKTNGIVIQKAKKTKKKKGQKKKGHVIEIEGVEIAEIPQGGRYFLWRYAPINPRVGVAFDSYELFGRQSLKDPGVWAGVVRIRHSEAGLDRHYCETAGPDGFAIWGAQLVKTCPGKCPDPFNAPEPSWSVSN